MARRAEIYSVGEKIGELTVVEVLGPASGRSHVRYRMKCDCGEEKITEKGNLLQNGGKCTHKDRKTHPELVIGERYGCLTLEKKLGTEHSRNAQYLMRCDCGEAKVVFKHCALRRSDRCTHNPINHHKLYRTWRNIIRRCYDKKSKAYPSYGGRGIEMCDRWRNSFTAFLEDMGDRPEGFSIDRIDNNWNYCPENCRWATVKEQSRNKRTTVFVIIDSVKKSVADWCEETGIPYRVAANRIYEGWDRQLAVTTPVGMSRKSLERFACT